MIKRGVAMMTGDTQDLDILGASWYYHWGVSLELLTDPRYIPMNRFGNDETLPTDYRGYILFLNEPDVQRPFGVDIKPEVAAERYGISSKRYPNAKFITGGVVAHGHWWMSEFIRLCAGMKKPYAYHIHGYIQDSLTYEIITGYLQRHIDLWKSKIWVSEFNDTRGRYAEMYRLTNWMENNPMVERYAAFTNRATVADPWYPGGWADLSLIDGNGALTKLGHAYSDVRKKIYMPMIGR